MMRLFAFLFAFLVSAPAFAACGSDLSTKPGGLSSGDMITRLLEERGAELMATQIGLFEIWMKNGEKMISKIYFSTDGSKAMTEEVLAAFRSRLSVRVHQVERINMWEINRVTGGIVIRSIPVGKVSEMNNSVSAVP